MMTVRARGVVMAYALGAAACVAVDPPVQTIRQPHGAPLPRPVVASEAIKARGLAVHGNGKYDILSGTARLGPTTRAFTCAIDSQAPFLGILVARAVDAQGRELARTREPVVLESHDSRAVRFTFEHELDPERVDRFVVDIESEEPFSRQEAPQPIR
jgi:hypothetical protein